MTRVVIATHNQGKVAELRRILAETAPGVELVAYDGPEPVEDGDSFAANALIKARAAARHTGLPALADDSGISAAALGGAPGIHSARYAGTRDDDDNIDKLLAELAGADDRSAWFSCAAALVVPPAAGTARPDGPASAGEWSEHVEYGEWHGTVLEARVGSNGHGYDPVFRPEGGTRSSAELTADEKNAVSHRSRAFRAIAPYVAALAG
ncbi:non-canonical purine NTP pyrophosphatase [Frigoribacterium faeni]|uniref:dITP/XTP pyrophosphatase n=1 Tax=Frigoribacterium faeni TaxID=145483 RepID=A0A7W3JIH9_9MICO|nr:non-canonical purine NTP pyrophosphatase [Frigoribacterium faeni]MBA8813430.1 XTP/dITP diphosphohydrolase [Frigoribacterium faeni]GEK83052.1 non-canonical purine NTP pyrophosphatase [Frigoribacterium faeni]